MAIGRPISLTPNIATKNISSLATADQTEFTVTGGYRINEIAVYRNGVRLAEGRDFTASDGDTVTLLSACTVSDVIEFAVFDSFNVAGTIVSAASTQTINGDLNVTGKFYSGSIDPNSLNVAGVGTITRISNTSLVATSATVSAALHVGSALTANAAGDVETIGIITAASFSGDGTNITGVVGVGTLNVRTESLTVSGVSTLTGVTNVTGVANFASAINADATTDSTSTSTGALIVDGGVGIAKNVYIGAGLSVAGTLTYEDVTSVDSVGLITAKSGVNITGGELTVGSGITMGIAGVATFSGTSDVHLHDNVRLNIGDGSDLTLYHNGTSDFIESNGSYLIIEAGNHIFRNLAGNEDYAKFLGDQGVELYYDGSKKWETTKFGTITTGIATATEGDITSQLLVGSGITMGSAGVATFSGTSDVHLVDNVQLLIGDSRDLRVHNNGTDNRLDTYGVNLDLINKNADGGVYEKMLRCVPNGAVEAYYDASKKWETTNDGTVTTGIATAAGLRSSGSATVAYIEARSTSTQATDSNKALRVRNNSDDNTFSVSYRGEVFVGPYDGGFLGIGTDNPQTQLHITAAGPVITHDATNGSSGLRINSQQYQTAGQLLRLQNAGITTFVVEDNGFVGINTSIVRRGPLHVHQNSTGDCQIHLTNDETGPTSSDGFTIFTGGNAGPNAGFVNRETGGDIQIYTHNGSSVGLRLTIEDEGDLVSTAAIEDVKGNVRSIPHNSQTSNYTLVATDAGKVVSTNTTGWVIPASIFAGGDVVTLMNRSGGNLAIDASALTTLYNSADGANVKASTLTLATRTMATIWFEASTSGYIQASALTVS